MSVVQERSESSHRTSATLLARVRLNDPGAWRRLLDLYGPLVFHWGKRWGLSDEDAADLLQDVFFAVARGIGRFEPAAVRGRFRGWLWTIALNKFRDGRRRAHATDAARGGDAGWEMLVAAPEEWSDDSSAETRSEVQALFQRAIQFVQGEFEPRTWETFWRVVVEGQSTQEAASAMELSPAAVRQAKSRVLRRLREELGDA